MTTDRQRILLLGRGAWAPTYLRDITLVKEVTVSDKLDKTDLDRKV